MEFKVIEQEFSICKIHDMTQVNVEDPYFFVGKTDEELSLVCGLFEFKGCWIFR